MGFALKELQAVGVETPKRRATMYLSVLVPLDGSPFGEQALPLALSIARRAGATIHLVHVHNPAVMPYTSTIAPAPTREPLHVQQERDEQVYLEGIAARLRSAASVPIHPVLIKGEVVPMLRATATSVEADLVVMTTHGRGVLGRFWLGSVADQLVRELPVPLLLVRPREGSSAEVEPDVRRVLVPLDGTPLGETVLEQAIKLGSVMEAEYVLLHVIPPLEPVAFHVGAQAAGGLESAVAHAEAVHKMIRHEAEDYLDGVAGRLRERGLRVRTRVVVGGQPGLVILREAELLDADLIALETQGRRGLSRMMLGSVADKVVRGATIPVLVQRPVYE
jgi:nucleotide-binding universal stress UspA family protein